MSLTEMMNLRTRFEHIIEEYKLDSYGSDIYSLKQFIENGHKSNSLRNDFREAMEIAEAIVTEYENVREDSKNCEWTG